MKTRYKIVPSSYLILLQDDKILLQRRCNTGFEDGKYGLVAGHVEEGETFLQGLVREAKEESGVIVKPEDLEVIHVMHRKGPNDERVDVFIRAHKWEGESKIMEPEKCDGMGWFPLTEIPGNTIPYIRQAIEYIRQNKFYSEHGWM
jgi:ADP-ribose pyrophosphatase YjhB (NUDIX family)